MVQLVCQNDIVVSHSYARHCLCTLDDVAAKDYLKSGWFDKRILCLSLDDYERKVLQGSNDCTIDAAIGVGNYINNRTTVTRLMLVELRMGYGYHNVDNLSVSSLENKISHSRSLLSDCNIDNNNYFIFKEGVAEQAKSWAERKKKEGGICYTWAVLSVNEFNRLIQFVEDMPYVPKTDLAQIRKQLSDCIANKNWRELCDQTDYWQKKALSYKHRYELPEYEAIRAVLLDAWRVIEPDQLGLNTSSDDYCFLSITKEDLSCLQS